MTRAILRKAMQDGAERDKGLAMIGIWRKYIAFTVICWIMLAWDASAQNCKNFRQSAQASIGSHVTAMRRYEHEASDRLKGLDSRPFEYLLGEARKTAEIIGEPTALEREKELRRCRNWTQPVRTICFEAANALVAVLAKYVANPKPDYDKPGYAAAVQDCEKLMDLKPLKSLIRGTD